MAPPAFASGPIHVPHISGRSIALGELSFEVVCPGCSLDLGKALKESKFKESMDIVLKGVHVENMRVLDKPNVKPVPTQITISSASYYMVVGRSISIKSPPDSGFDVVCPYCAYHLGTNPSIESFNIILQGKHLHATTPVKENATKEDASQTINNTDDETTQEKGGEAGVDGNWKKAVIGNDGVTGIKIKGGDIDLEIETSTKKANPATSSNPTIALKNGDELVANNHGVAGIDLEATGHVKVIIKEDNP